MRRIEKNKFLYFLIILFILLFTIPTYPNLNKIKTNKTYIEFKDMDDLYRMNSKLNFEQDTDFLQGYSLSPSLAHQPLCSELCPKVDGLLFKVCKILPKCPNRQPPLTIELMNNASEVHQQFSIISPFQHNVPDSLEGFFSSGFNVIYMSMEEFRPGVLAHEMTHYLLCQFSPIPDMEL